MDEMFVPFTKDPSTKIDGDAPALLTSLNPPWMQNEVVDFDTPPFVRFHNEILTFCEYIAPTISEMSTRHEIIAEFTAICKELWPDVVVKVFGSQMTKILTPTSDIDIAVIGVPVAATKSIVDSLYDLSDRLRERDMVSYVEVIANAKVPIVKFDHKLSGISVDVLVNNTSGLDTGVFFSLS